LPIAYRFVSKDLTIIVWDGPVTVDEWRRHILALTGEESFPTRELLVDLRAASFESVTPEVSSEMALLYVERLSGVPDKTAVLGGDSGYEIVERWEDQLHRAAHMAVFRDLSDACRWLGNVVVSDIEQSLNRLRLKMIRPSAS
jgi:hypothetical protein